MGIACLHTVTQMELWIIREVKMGEQKQGAGVAAASPELQGLAPWPVPARRGSRARPQPLPTGRPLLHRGGMHNLPKAPGTESGSHFPMLVKETHPKAWLCRWGPGKNELIQLWRTQGEGSGSSGIFIETIRADPRGSGC